MKQILMILIVMSIGICQTAAELTHDGYLTLSSSSYTEEGNCELCGAYIERESDYDYTMITADAVWFGVWEQDPYEWNTIEVDKSMDVCYKCYDKYGSKFHNDLTQAWQELKDIYRVDEAYLKKTKDLQRLQELKCELIKIKKELDKLTKCK